MKARKTEIKIAYIGGGSKGWAWMVMRDLALCPKLTGEMALYDIDLAAARKNVTVSKKIFGHKDARTKFRVRACSRLPDALKGADFVMISVTPGPMQMFANDLDIPAKYGILQTVGDSTGPGGISRALRSIPIYAGFAHAIMKHCPNAWVISYTNPMTLCTSTLYEAEPDIKAFGCCHEVFGAYGEFARLIAKNLKVKEPVRHEIQLDVSGVNHFTFATAASWKGIDLFPFVHARMKEKNFFHDCTAGALERKAVGRWFSGEKQIAYDFLRRFGVLGAAGDRHLAEFVPWYLKSEEEIHRWGVLLTPSSFRLKTWRSADPKVPPPPPPRFEIPRHLVHSSEEGIEQIMALSGIEPMDTNVNMPNRGQIPGLPLGAIVETNAQIRRDSVIPVVAKPLPVMLNNLVRRIVENQRAVLKAGMTCDKELAFQAILSDPLVQLPTDKAWKMFNEMLKANKSMLPGWKI